MCTIEAKRQAFACTVIIDAILQIRKGLTKAQVSEETIRKVSKVVEWVAKEYRWEISDKNKLEALLDIIIWL
jgi:hypothetical protein